MNKEEVEIQNIKRYISWKNKLNKEVRGGILMFDVPKNHKWLTEEELFEYFKTNKQ